MRDTDVAILGPHLAGKHILLGVSGGIAAVDTIRVCRELRRYEADVTVFMTQSAQKIISPESVKWSSQGLVITDWESNLEGLKPFDAILVMPATRNLIASIVNGMMNGPLLMAISSARARKTPCVIVPSMHLDLANDPATSRLCDELLHQGFHLEWGPIEEGKRKNPNVQFIVAKLCHLLNKNNKAVVITLGATKSSIDDVRFIQNRSSGKTGFTIAEYLYRDGMDVTCVAGSVSVNVPDFLPLVISSPDPNDMLLELKALSHDQIDAWVHAAAVLDYVVKDPAEGKLASQQSGISVDLVPTSKHLDELEPLTKNAIRIGFKLESGIKTKDLVHRAIAQNERANLSATIANRLEDLANKDKPRGYLVDRHGAHFVLHTEFEMCQAIASLIRQGS